MFDSWSYIFVCAASYAYWCIVFLFSFTWRYFLNSVMISLLTHWMFKNMILNFYTFVNFLVFFLLMISHIAPLWFQSILCLIYILLNLLRLVLCPSVVYPLKCSMCLWKHCVFWCFCVECCFYVRSGWFILLFKPSMYLLTFCGCCIHY